MMPLPFFGPPRLAPTHKPMDLARALSLAEDLEAYADGGILTHDALQRFAEAEGVALREAYAAASYNPALRFEPREEVAVALCGGGCQQWGALELIGDVLSLKDEHARTGGVSFDVTTRSCLNACDHGPTVMIQSRHGVFGVRRATKAKIEEALGHMRDETSSA